MAIGIGSISKVYFIVAALADAEGDVGGAVDQGQASVAGLADCSRCASGTSCGEADEVASGLV